MMRRISGLFLAMSLILGGCSDNDDEGPDLLADARETILGAWAYEYTTHDCTLTVEFLDATNFIESSSNEVQSGTYALSKIEGEPELFFLELEIVEDNGLTDCDGNNVADVETLLTDVSFPDENSMLWSTAMSPDTLLYQRVTALE